MPDGNLNEQTRDTARESVLAAFGQALPAPADPPGLVETAEGVPADTEAPGAP